MVGLSTGRGRRAPRPGPRPGNGADPSGADRQSRRAGAGSGCASQLGGWASGAVFLLAVLVYLPSLRYGFIGYDDTLLIVQNQEFLSRWANLPRAFLQDAFHVPGYSSSEAYYRPVMTISLLLDAQIGGTAPWVYHASNLLQHGVASSLLLLVLWRLGHARGPSFFLAALFALHPTLMSVVAWVPGRVDALLAIFAFLAFHQCIDFVERGSVRAYVLHVVAFALALFTKEPAALLPIPLLAYVHGVRGERSFGPRSRLLVAGWTATLALWATLRNVAVESPVGWGELLGNLGRNALVVVHFVGKAFLPIHLSVTPTLEDTPVWPGLVVFAALLVAVATARRRRPAHLALGATWFLVFVLPPLLVPRKAGLEQRLYVPLLGLFLVVLEIGLLERWGRAIWGRALAFAVVVAFGALTLSRIPAYSSRERFWETAVATAPHASYARASLGAYYVARGRYDEAEEQYRIALELDPREPRVSHNLGYLAHRAGRLAEAVAHFEREIQFNPTYADAYFNLAMLRAQMGDEAAAVALWQETLEREPNHRQALEWLIRYHASRGEQAAVKEYEERLAAARAVAAPG